MRALRRFLNRLAASAIRRRDADRLNEEIEEHLALQTAENVRAGLPPAEARRQAVLAFGPVGAIKERYRDAQRLPLLDNLLQDVRYALRQFRNAPLFTVTAVLSLAMGIGANAAVFTVIERVLLRPLPVSNAHELVYVTDQRAIEGRSPRFSYPFYAVLRDNIVLRGLAARFSMEFNAAIEGRVTRVAGELVSGNYFSVVGAGMQLGRGFSEGDDRTPGAYAVAVISDDCWRRDFASDPSVIGGTVQLNARTFTIAGVAAKGFTGTDIGLPTDIWIPMMMQREVGRDLLTDARTNWIELVGRLPAGVDRERAGAELTAYLERRAPELHTRFPGRALVLVPGDKGTSPLRRELGPALRVLLALTALALVLACINVASLLSVRSAAREKEFAVRLALGAGRSRLSAQFLTETTILALIGGTAGLLIAPRTSRSSNSRPRSSGISSVRKYRGPTTFVSISMDSPDAGLVHGCL